MSDDYEIRLVPEDQIRRRTTVDPKRMEEHRRRFERQLEQDRRDGTGWFEDDGPATD